MKNKMISIIIPVYNTEKYLRECLASVLRQTYKNFEVLLIDDGSMDASPQIVQEFMHKDSRIRFYAQEHFGVSMARNIALDLAQGEFLFFLDSDDMIAPKMLELMYEQIQLYRVEMSFCQYLQTDNLDDIQYNENKEWIFCSNSELIELFSKKPNMFGIGGKLIARNSIGALRFDRDFEFGEDTLFLYELIKTGITSCYTSAAMYYYRKREDNTRSLLLSLKGLTDIFRVTKRLALAEKLSGQIENSYLWEMRCLEKIRNALVFLPKNEWIEMKKVIKKEFKRPYFHLNCLKTRISVFLGYCSYPLYHKTRKLYQLLKPGKNSYH